MSAIPPELRDYIEPLVRVGHVTVTVYERCLQEALRLGLTQVEGEAYLRRLAEEHDAILEAPPRPELAATAAWEPQPANESSEDVPTKADLLDDVPSDSEERAALAAAQAAEVEELPEEPLAQGDESAGVALRGSDSLADVNQGEADQGEADQGEAGQVLASPGTETKALLIGDALEVAEVTSPEPTSPEPTSPEPTSPEPTSPEPTSPEPTSPEPTTSDVEPAAGDEDLAPVASAAAPQGGFRGIPWLHLAPVVLAPLLALFVLGSGGIEAAQDHFGGGDPFEPNNVFAEAKVLSNGKHTGITLHRDDVDWFRLQVEAGKGISITYENVPSEAGVSLHDSSGARLERVGEDVGELVYVPPGGRPQEVYLVLSGSSHEIVTLNVSQIDPRQRFEENDLPAQASEVEPGRISSLACDGSDWFSLVVPAHRALTGKVSGGLGLRILEVRDRTGQASTPQSLPPEATISPFHLPRRVLVQITGTGDYTVDLDLEPLDRKSAIAAGDVLPTIQGGLEPNNRREEASELKAGYYPDLRCDGADYYTVRVPAKHTLTLDWRGSPNISFPDLVSRTFGGDLDSNNNTADNRQRRVFFARRDVSLTVLARGRGTYPLTCRITPGLPGRELTPGAYSQIKSAGDDLFWIVAEADDNIDFTFDVGRADRYGRQVEVSLVRVPLPQGELETPSRRRRRPRSRRPLGRSARTEYISGVDTLSQRFFARELVFLRVRMARAPYDLEVEVQRNESAGEAGNYRPPRYELAGPGTYAGRTVENGVYGIDLDPGDRLEACVAFSSQLGDIDVELLDSHGEVAVDSTGDGDLEEIFYEAKAKERVFLFVRDLTGSETVYDLEIKINDEAKPRGRKITKGRYAGLVCAGESVLAIDVKAGQVVRAKIKFDETKGELDMGMLDGSGREQLRAAELGPTEILEYVVTEDGEVFLRVNGEGKRFDLELAIQDP